MKTIIRFFGIIAITAIIVFSMSTCDNGTTPETHTHVWGEWVQTTPSTCTEAGIKTRACTLDHSHIDTETQTGAAPLGHDWEYATGSTPATCTTEGSGSRDCKRCELHEDGVTFEIDPDAHDWGEWEETTAPTCEDDGMETRTCSHDATHTETQAVDALGHAWGEWEETTPATFIVAGEETRTCSVCGEEETRPGDDQLAVKTATDWTSAISHLTSKTGAYTLTIAGEVGVAGTPNTAYTFGTTSATGLSVTLQGSGKLYLTSQGNMFRINANQTLIIDSEDLTLEGLKNGQNGSTQDNNAALVYVNGVTNGAHLELRNGTISGNYNGGGIGGGVYVVYPNATFSMSGGKISGNYSWSDGGGVKVDRGTFTMRGGAISGNSAADNGGGVHIAGTDGTFIMRGGEISGNSCSFNGGGSRIDIGTTFLMETGTIYGRETDLDAALRNTAGTSGAAIRIDASTTAEYGTFSGDTWTAKGTLSTSVNTIKVVNGVLQ